MSFMDARDFGSKPGSGGAATAANEAIDRRERLRRLAMETIDIAKDPYFMRNHSGKYECRLCLTLHSNEGNYLAHTQGKRHQTNLAKRAQRELEERENSAANAAHLKSRRPMIATPKTPRIGRPAYRVTKQYDRAGKEKSLLFQVEYPEIDCGDDAKPPRHRYMSSFEQRQEPADRRYQYLLFAAEPYEVIGFKIPNMEMVKSDEKFYAHWDAEKKVYTLQLTYKAGGRMIANKGGPPPMHPVQQQQPPPPQMQMQMQMPQHVPPRHMMMMQPPPPSMPPPGPPPYFYSGVPPPQMPQIPQMPPPPMQPPPSMPPPAAFPPPAPPRHL